MTPFEATALESQRDALRVENERLVGALADAHAKYLGAIEANEGWHQKVIELRRERDALAAVLEGPPEVLEAVARALANTMHMTIDAYSGKGHALAVLATLRAEVRTALCSLSKMGREG